MASVRRPTFQRRRTVSAWVLTVATVCLGAWVSFFGSEIRAASALFYRNRFDLSGYELHWETIVFFVTFGIWAVALLVRLLADDKEEWVRRERLMQAIHRVPNFDVIQDYPAEVRKLIAVLIGEIDESLSDDVRMTELETRIRSVLRSIAMMASSFAHHESVRYGANIMLAVKVDEAHKTIFQRLRFHNPANKDALQALLYLPDGLLVADVSRPESKGKKRTVPLIALPVTKANPDGSREVLPGAPFAFVHGRVGEPITC